MEPRNLELAKCLRHRLHEHPEVSNHETWTKQRLMEFIKTHTKLEIVDKGNWFYAIYRSGEGSSDENIAFRADFDALPMDEGIALPWGSKIPGAAHKFGMSASRVICSSPSGPTTRKKWTGFRHHSKPWLEPKRKRTV
jgi:metal-dependent amidase/aminoacylase/carboxypeptidase family protein